MGAWSLGDVFFIVLVCGLIYLVLRLVSGAKTSTGAKETTEHPKE
ncbi:hypothetical protein DESUT3_20320 [Desulfuromonas versatilis]|uniref:Hmc operon protein 4 n=1 Tax=Desulfuromonas versatilis TaxID=2802975 RepID=A0ABN6DXV7_9BACT|nr:hypothetical protein [Desulfuromonas versatilis]BCR04963.1 hypothetical protein DESUT3_20320 [Desulfuromonas versatilis]